jgi:SAM-dependent methyltransferase
MPTDGGPTTAPDTAAGAAIYSRFVLAFYDLEVLHLELPFVFGCRARAILDLYDRNVSGTHLDVGVGTGYFLDRCRFPVERPEIHLMDLNANSLGWTARRIRRYAPVAHRCDVLAPVREPLPRFGSIGLSNLLHCLPGTMGEKQAVFRNLAPFLREDGVLFGVTVLGQGVDGAGALYRGLNRLYNRKRIFCNLADSAAALDEALAASFARHCVWTVGAMAFFTASARGG